MSTPVTRAIVIRNKQGLHARPASLFVQKAHEFRCEIVLVRESQRVQARNMMDLLTLGAGPGTELVLEANGDDAREAVEALAQLVEVGFLEEDAAEEQSQAGDKS